MTDFDLNRKHIVITPELVVIISDCFSFIIREWATTEQMATIRSKNDAAVASGNMGVCHTHDYFDSNMALCEAFEDNDIKTVIGEISEDTRFAISYSNLWNQVWERSKRLGFDNGVEA
jgi:hypothetical protein